MNRTINQVIDDKHPYFERFIFYQMNKDTHVKERKWLKRYCK